MLTTTFISVFTGFTANSSLAEALVKLPSPVYDTVTGYLPAPRPTTLKTALPSLIVAV